MKAKHDRKGNYRLYLNLLQIRRRYRQYPLWTLVWIPRREPTVAAKDLMPCTYSSHASKEQFSLFLWPEKKETETKKEMFDLQYFLGM